MKSFPCLQRKNQLTLWKKLFFLHLSDFLVGLRIFVGSRMGGGFHWTVRFYLLYWEGDCVSFVLAFVTVLNLFLGKYSLLLLQMEGNSKWTSYPCICSLFYESLGFRSLDSFLCLFTFLSVRRHHDFLGQQSLLPPARRDEDCISSVGKWVI